MIQRRIVVLLLTLYIALPAGIGAAQTPDISAEMEAQSPGIQAQVMRFYLHPAAEVGRPLTPDEMATLALSNVGIAITNFDTVEHAAAEFEKQVAYPPGLTSASNMPSITLEEMPLEGVGDQAFFRQQSATQPMTTLVAQTVIVQAGTNVVSVFYDWRASNLDETEPAAELTVPDLIVPLATQIATAPDPGVATVADDGSFTGGIWNLLPQAGDPLLLGLVPSDDTQGFPFLMPAEASPVSAAQSDWNFVDPSTLPGVGAIGERIYMPGGTGIGIPVSGDAAATPVAAVDTTSRQELSLSITINQFETSEDAASAFAELSANVAFPGPMNPAAATTDQADLPDVGDQASTSRMVITNLGVDWVRETTLEQVTVLNGEMVIVLQSASTRGTAGTLDLPAAEASPIPAIAEAIVARGEPTTTEPMLVSDGSSTGGFWDLLPVAGDPLLMGLVPKIDIDIVPGTGQ